jgi:hypothetical protein
MRKSFIDSCLWGSVLVKTIDYTLERSSVKPMAGLVKAVTKPLFLWSAATSRRFGLGKTVLLMMNVIS